MSDFDNTNSGALFKNKKRTNDKQPDYTGRVNADGKDFWVSAWIKTSKAGEKFMSMALTPVDAPINTDGIDDDIPF